MGLEGCELHAFELGGAMFKERLGLGAACSLKEGEEEEGGWPSLLASFGIEKGRSDKLLSLRKFRLGLRSFVFISSEEGC